MTILSITRDLAMGIGALALVGTLAACGGTTTSSGEDQSPPSEVDVTTSTTDGTQDTDVDTEDKADAQSETSAELAGIIISCPDGWSVVGDTDDSVSVAQTPGTGAIDIVLRSVSDLLPDAQGWAESIASTTGIEGSIETFEVNGTTWYGMAPDETSFILYADNPADPSNVVSVTGEGISIDDAMSMLEGIALGA